ncbi:MAG TPA: peptide chain release factor N(5)-glutamine methyltransferase [Thermotogota bacterium]|nr:peptide chain release factor N(5)-glutamine methyltransferase [Thermotogota bacterium]HRW34692.1 peptide chain release factor N(5)-glutamine methyltransferase [Thermotogota bacterium]
MRKIQNEWTVGKVINWTQGYLERKGVDSPRKTTEKLMEMMLNMDKTHLYINWQKQLEAQQLSSFKQLLNRVVEGEPVAYVTGVERFYSYDFIVSKDVLIPRQETEELVEWMVKDHRDRRDLQIADIGTGSGVIAITLAKLMPGVKIIATDIQKACIEIAEKNAIKHGVELSIKFYQGDFLEPLDAILQEIDVLVSNPPYISKDDLDHMDQTVLEHEPHQALFGGQDGLLFYQRLAQQADRLRGKTVYLEAGFNQKKALEELFDDKIQDYKKDMNGNWRMLKLRF